MPPAATSHVSDPILQPFLSSTFDPIDYLNSTLPSLSISSTSSANPSHAVNRSSASTETASLADLSAQTQTLLSQLNAQINRLSDTLTQLTDDILRSGGRLAYQVEVLRGESAGFAELLSDGLKEDISQFIANGLKLEPVDPITEPNDSTTGLPRRKSSAAASLLRQRSEDVRDDPPKADAELPEYVVQLRTLTQVRARLESVVKVFGEAMQWTIPPSEVSIGASLIAVAGADSDTDRQSREEKGKAFSERLRNEIADTVLGADSNQSSNGDSQGTGLEAATARVQALRDLSIIWKGTAEEKARTKFVDSLIKLAEERSRSQKAGQPRQKSKPSSAGPASTSARPNASEKNRGFLENLQRIRENIYLE